MKTSSFLTGIALGAAAAFALSKKFGDKLCPCKGAAGDNAVKDAEDAVEKLRGSVESLTGELNKRIESEQTYAAKCEELKDQVSKQAAEIENLKNICDVQNNCNKKLEEELAQAQASK